MRIMDLIREEHVEGDVLELGMGIFSTPFLHYRCDLDRRKLVSYENSKEYFDIFKDYKDENHDIIFTKDWNINIDKKWSVAFIDLIPDEIRKDFAAKLVNLATFIILHDTQPEDDSTYKYSEIYPLFKWVYHVKNTRTSVLSNSERIYETSPTNYI